MPELPEVRTVVKDLRAKVLNKQISNVTINLSKLIKNISSSLFKQKIKNKKINNITNYGKFIIFHLSSNLFLVSHLRMEGKYHTEKWVDNSNDHLIFKFNDKSFLFYNDTRQFGTFHLFEEEPFKLIPLNKLAKEPQNTNVDFLYNKLQKKRIAIKTALLDQSILVGLGNIYVNEVLWDVKINPTKASYAISRTQIKNILKSATRIMDHSTKLGGSSIDSYTSLDKQSGSYQKLLNVHTKKGKKCPRCKDFIKKIKVNGRGTYYCSTCQK